MKAHLPSTPVVRRVPAAVALTRKFPGIGLRAIPCGLVAWLVISAAVAQPAAAPAVPPPPAPAAAAVSAAALAPAVVSPVKSAKWLSLDEVVITKRPEGYTLTSASMPAAEFPSVPAMDRGTRELLDSIVEDKKNLALPWALEIVPVQTLREPVALLSAQSVAQGRHTSGLSDATRKALEFYDQAYKRVLSVTDRLRRKQRGEEVISLADRSDDQLTADLFRNALRGSFEETEKILDISSSIKRERRVVSAKTGSVDKSLYNDHQDIFKPGSYQALLRNLHRIAGIFEEDADTTLLRGAGVFVGPRVVLTCAHNLVWLQPLRSHVLVSRDGVVRHYVFDRVLLDASKLAEHDPAYSDLALIEVRPLDPATELPFPPLVLAGDRLDRPVYVLAFHNQDSRSPGIYDSGHVLFPSVADHEEMPKVFRLSYENAIARLATADQRRLAQAGIIRQVKAAYGFVEGQGGPGTKYRFRGPSQAVKDHPRFAFDTDTVGGNSGGGVFAKDTGQLLGIFGSGMPDNAVNRRPSWDDKEQGIPLPAVDAVLRVYCARRAAGGHPEIDFCSSTNSP